MPYVDSERQYRLTTGEQPTETAGDLTYLLYYTALDHLQRQQGEIRYADLNEIRGAMIGAWQEFEDQIVRPYETLKQTRNPVPAARQLVRRIINQCS